MQDWLSTDIEVRVKSKNEQRAVIRRIESSKKRCHIAFIGSRDEQDIDATDLVPVRPEKKDKVKILSGEFSGQVGALIGIDQQDGIVKLSGSSDFKILRMSILAKYVEL